MKRLSYKWAGGVWGAMLLAVLIASLSLDAKEDEKSLESPANEKTLRAARYIQKGKELSEIGDYLGALMDFAEAIRLDPEYSDGYYYRGVAKGKSGDTDGAVEDFSTVLKLNPVDDRALYSRGIIHANKGDYEGTIKDLSEAITLEPENAHYIYVRGKAKLRNKDYDGAIMDLTEAYRIDKKQILAIETRGRARIKKEDFKGAIKDFNHVISQDPQNHFAYALRGEAKFLSGNRKAAVDDYTRAIKRGPNKPSYYFARGLMRYAEDRIEVALDDFQMGRRLIKSLNGRDYSWVWTWMAMSRKGLAEEANSELRRHLNKRDEDLKTDWYLTLTGFLLGEVEESVLFEEAKSGDDDEQKNQFTEAWFYAAQVYLIKNDLVKAAEYLKKTVEIQFVDSFEYKPALIQFERLGGN